MNVMKPILVGMMTLFTLILTACSNDRRMNRIGYEGGHYKALPSGRVEFKQHGPTMVSEADGLSYLKATC